MTAAEGQQLRRLSTDDLSRDDAAEVRALMDEAFGDGEDAFEDGDWLNAIGGMHFLLTVDGRLVSHASVVRRTLHLPGVALPTGYVEAVATLPTEQGKGYGTAVMRAAAEHIEGGAFELGALGTGESGFYERLGWRRWRGPSGVLRGDGRREPTPADDGYVMVLGLPHTPALDWDAPITCEERAGSP